LKKKQPKWRKRLKLEQSYIKHFEEFSEEDLIDKANSTSFLSSNHDTVVSLDWPHFCYFATEACGGVSGWCYTLTGINMTDSQAKKSALTDVVARRYPNIFAERVESELRLHIKRKTIKYLNLRYSGAGELHPDHLNAILAIKTKGINLWGFTKNPKLALILIENNISVLYSCDLTTSRNQIEWARNNNIPLAYSSDGIHDIPPENTFVTFPIHVSGRVSELVDHNTLCPKVVEEFLNGDRTPAWCQQRCKRCHNATQY
jgi:hypothetical protein